MKLIHFSASFVTQSQHLNVFTEIQSDVECGIEHEANNVKWYEIEIQTDNTFSSEIYKHLRIKWHRPCDKVCPTNYARYVNEHRRNGDQNPNEYGAYAINYRNTKQLMNIFRQPKVNSTANVLDHVYWIDCGP